MSSDESALVDETAQASGSPAKDGLWRVMTRGRFASKAATAVVELAGRKVGLFPGASAAAVPVLLEPDLAGLHAEAA